MTKSIGVVCEGSHDFNMLKVFILKLAADEGYEVGDIDCLQPKVSASFQTSSGGWGRVKGWCEQGSGKGYRVHLDKPLFGISKTYDLLLIHLDGDVVTLCTAKPLASKKIESLSSQDAVDALKNAILNHWLSPEQEHLSRIIVCAPVWHMEAWLLAALDDNSLDVENRPTKEEFKAGLFNTFSGKTKDRYIEAAQAAAVDTAKISQKCFSFAAFRSDLSTAAKAA